MENRELITVSTVSLLTKNAFQLKNIEIYFIDTSFHALHDHEDENAEDEEAMEDEQQ